jgi:hypothetical protein
MSEVKSHFLLFACLAAVPRAVGSRAERGRPPAASLLGLHNKPAAIQQLSWQWNQYHLLL